MTNPLVQLGQFGQAPWLDYLHRKILEDGELKRLIEEDGVRGLTSNPSIFEQAIGGGDAYDAALAKVIAQRDDEVMALYEHLAIADIRAAADAFRPLYDKTGGADGYVSLEVSPYLAMDTEGTIADARRLWSAVNRPNLMVKVPGTAPGVPAIRTLIGEGININVTLLFAIDAYLAVAEAHMAGLEAFRAKGGDVSKVHGVASFFISRIDVSIDKAIDQRIKDAPPSRAVERLGVRGKVGVASGKVAYQRYLEMMASPRWKSLAAAGAAPQRLLWASTGVKDPAFPDTYYVESLIGPDTVDTIPPKTMDAFRDHGKVAETLAQNPDDARAVLEKTQALGLDLDGVTDDLVKDGVAKFAGAFDELLAAVGDKRSHILGPKLNGHSLQSPPELGAAINDTMSRAAREGWTRRLWARDASLWTGADEGKWMGWLDAASGAAVDLDELEALAARVKAAGYGHAVLLGMGGSSLGPEVLATTFGPAAGHLPLLVLDSTDPEQIARIEGMIDPARTLFVVSSKSGSTLEPDILHRYFYRRVEAAVGEGGAGAHFLAVTDPGSNLEKSAKADGFAQVFFGDPAIGGRYSVLSNFGMVPAAILGLDVRSLFETAKVMARACGASAPPSANPGFRLGVALGVAARAGRDKVTLIASPPIAEIGAWLEQLLAESTGKQGRGLIPVDAEPLGAARLYGADRFIVQLRLEGHDEADRDELARDLAAAGHPVARITLADTSQLAQEFVRWEVAVAVAGAVIGIDPFNQPDVEASKVKSRELTDAWEASGVAPAQAPVFEDSATAVFADAANAKALAAAIGQPSLEAWLGSQFARVGQGDYVGLLAYLDRNEANTAALQSIRGQIRDRLRSATVLGFGPRFLHSTGQAYKGGPNSGVFIEITAQEGPDLAVPGRKVTFGQVLAAQAQGDLAVLCERGRRCLRVHIKGGDVRRGLERLAEAVDRSLP